jgi:MFS family permease
VSTAALALDEDAPRARAHHLLAAVMGNALEVYDFTSYAYFAVMIGQAFFPAQDKFISLLLSLVTFGIGFLSRPLGGIFLGAYADRAGRRPAMMLSFLLMGVGSAALALTPGYASIGIAAPLIILVARLVQGFALGGEIAPATAFMLEAAPSSRRGFYGSLQAASQGISTLASGTVGIALSLWLTNAQIYAWGWRVPFLIGTLILPLGIFIRRSLPETLHREERIDGLRDMTLRELMAKHGRAAILGFTIISSLTVAFYTFAYLTTYAITTLHMSTLVSLAATAVLGVCNFIFSLGGGRLSDLLGRKPVMMLRVALALFAYPLFMLLNLFPTAVTIFAVTAALSFLNAPANAVALVAVSESLPKAVRCASLGTVYALAVAVFGGTTQAVIAWSIKATGDPLAPAWYLAVTTVIGAVAMGLMKETAPRLLTPP